MKDRNAVSTLKGYFYQFDFSILQLLSLASMTDKVTIEGIEDVDITTIDKFFISKIQRIINVEEKLKDIQNNLSRKLHDINLSEQLEEFQYIPCFY